MKIRSLLLAAFAAPLFAHAAELTLEVDGLDATRLEGSALFVAVYNEAGQWMGKPAVGRRFAMDPKAGGRMTVTLVDLPEGPLALSVFHDTNGNGRMDRNAMGIPIEPYGFSNNATGQFGPPRFEQAVLAPSADSVIRVTLN